MAKDVFFGNTGSEKVSWMMDVGPEKPDGDPEHRSDGRSQPVKILHVFGHMNRDGAQTRTLELMRKLRSSEWRFDFCVLSGQSGDLDGEIRELGGAVHSLPLSPGFPVRFKRLLLKHRYDAVQSHVHYFSGYIMKLAHKAGTPTRVVHFRTVRDFHGNNLFRRLYRRLMKYWIGRYSNQILAVSKAVMDASWGEDWHKDLRCRVVYNGIDLQPFMEPNDRSGVLREFDLPENGKLCIHVGRMIPTKNHDRLVSVFAEIVRRIPHARLLLVGRGDNDVEARIRERVTQLGLTSNVLFLGHRTDVPRLLKAADLMIFPSLWEGLPGVCLEACAAGIPVLASDLPGIREIAECFHNVHYLGLDRDDREWASLGKMLLDEKKDKGEAGESIREFSESVFSLENCAKAHQEVWRANLPE